jgi:hypothetical protein
MQRCVVCGDPLPERRYSKTVIGCNRPECRQEIRRQAGLKSAQKIKAKSKFVRHCLRCEQVFKTANRYRRICGYCHGLEQHEPSGAEWWGAPI